MPANQAAISTNMLFQFKISEMWLSETSKQRFLTLLSFGMTASGDNTEIKFIYSYLMSNLYTPSIVLLT